MENSFREYVALCRRKQSRVGLQASVQVVRLAGEAQVEAGRGESQTDETGERDGGEGRRGNGDARDLRLHGKGT